MKSVGVRIRAVRKDRGSPTSVLFPLYFSVLSILIPYISRLFIYSAHRSLSRCFFILVLTPRRIVLTQHPRCELSAGRGMTQVFFHIYVCVCVCVICAGETCVSSVFVRQSTVLFVCEENVCVCVKESERDVQWETESTTLGIRRRGRWCVWALVCVGVRPRNQRSYRRGASSIKGVLTGFQNNASQRKINHSFPHSYEKKRVRLLSQRSILTE